MSFAVRHRQEAFTTQLEILKGDPLAAPISTTKEAKPCLTTLQIWVCTGRRRRWERATLVQFKEASR